MFFISVGMAVNPMLLAAHWPLVLAAVSGLILAKILICFVLAKLSRLDTANAVRFGFVLAQAGEFGFVIFATAVGAHVMAQEDAQLAALIITLSMFLTPLLFVAAERWIIPVLEREEVKPYDEIEGAENPVIICGFGRVGQIVGRLLRLRGIPFTALDKSAEQVELVRRFGNTAYYGDPTRLQLLRAAGADKAKILVVALDDINESLQLVEHAQRHFPHLTILARARNRRHVHLFMDRGVTKSVRETFHSSLRLGLQVLTEAGVPAAEAEHLVSIFEQHDERTLRTQHAVYRDEKQLIQTTRQIAEELRGLLEADAPDLPETDAPPSAVPAAGE